MRWARKARLKLYGFSGLYPNSSPSARTEAAERVLCLAIPFAENGETLENDPVFLRFALRQMAQKLTMSTMDVTMQTLEEKLLLYLEKVQPEHTIHSVNETVIAISNEMQRFFLVENSGTEPESACMPCKRSPEPRGYTPHTKLWGWMMIHVKTMDYRKK